MLLFLAPTIYFGAIVSQKMNVFSALIFVSLFSNLYLSIPMVSSYWSDQ